MIDKATITTAVELLQKAAPGAKVMLFGSYATGTATDASDVDLLVVEPQLGSRRAETARLMQALQPLGIPVDLIVISQSTFTSWSQFGKAITNLPPAPDRPYPAISFGVRIWSMFTSRPALASPA